MGKPKASLVVCDTSASFDEARIWRHPIVQKIQFFPFEEKTWHVRFIYIVYFVFKLMN